MAGVLIVNLEVYLQMTTFPGLKYPILMLVLQKTFPLLHDQMTICFSVFLIFVVHRYIGACLEKYKYMQINIMPLILDVCTYTNQYCTFFFFLVLDVYLFNICS